jgi:hypothetical protein
MYDEGLAVRMAKDASLSIECVGVTVSWMLGPSGDLVGSWLAVRESEWLLMPTVQEWD